METYPECKHPRSEIRYKVYEEIGKQYLLICSECGKTLKTRLGKFEIERIPSGTIIKPYDYDEQFPYRVQYREWYEKQQEAKKQEMRESYKERFTRPDWIEKKRNVLKRDNYLCQGCMMEKATEVHHLSYSNFGDELLFQLISLCRKCHDKIPTYLWDKNNG